MNYLFYIAKHFNCAISINTGFRKIAYLEYFYICQKLMHEKDIISFNFYFGIIDRQ